MPHVSGGLQESQVRNVYILNVNRAIVAASGATMRNALVATADNQQKS